VSPACTVTLAVTERKPSPRCQQIISRHITSENCRASAMTRTRKGRSIYRRQAEGEAPVVQYQP
jgi:hypothetical protein